MLGATCLFSKKLKQAETRYSTFDRELLAVVLAVKHFRHMVEARNLIIFTDHKPLESVMSTANPSWTARQQRHICFVSEYSTDIRHIKGKDNFVADALSRQELIHIGNTDSLLHHPDETLSPAVIQQRQKKDEEIELYKTAITGLDCHMVDIQGVKILCDISQGNPRPILPASLRRQAFELVHELAHPSIKETTRQVARRFVWHGMKKQVTQWTRACPRCQKCKVTQHIKSPLQEYPPAD